VLLYNILGQRVVSERVSLSTGYYTLNLSLAHLPTGVYFMRVVGRESHTVKIMKTGSSIHTQSPVLSVRTGQQHQQAPLARKSTEAYTIRAYKEKYDLKEITAYISDNISIDVPMERNNEVIFKVLNEDDVELEYELTISGVETNISILTPDTLILKSGFYTVKGDNDTSKVDVEIEITSVDTTITMIAQKSSAVAGTLNPGKFTESLNGIGIGTHFNAIVDSVIIEVEWFEPTDDPLFPSDIDWIERIDRFVEIRAVNNENEGIDPPIGTGFLVALPVPEDFDEKHLYPLEYSYGIFAPHSTSEINYWMPASGVFDPIHRVFLLSIPAIGSTEYPTRLGLIEHKTFETLETAEILDQILDGTFNNPVNNNTFYQKKTSSTIQFHVIRLGGPLSLRGTINQALLSAYDVYNQQLYNNPEPRLKRNVNSWMPGHDTFYTYYIHDENTSVIPLIPDSWIGAVPTCANPNIQGFYFPVTGTGVTCSEASNHARTTHHELFHAFQWGYNRPWSIAHSYIVEGTARLAENINDPLDISGRGIYPPVDEKLVVRVYNPNNSDDDSINPYRREHFFYDVFHRSGLTFEDLGRLLDTGLRTHHLDAFIRENTPLDSLGGAYWRWVRNVTFEADLVSDNFGIQCFFNEYSATPMEITIVPNDDDDETIVELELEILTSKVMKLLLEPDSEQYEITLGVDTDNSGLQYKFYLPEESGTELCRVDGRENTPQTFTVDDENVMVYLLVSNTNMYYEHEGHDNDEADDTLSVIFRVTATPPDIGIPGPAIGLSVGLDPTLLEGDDFGGLAGTYLDLFPVAVPIYDSQPPDLPRLEFDPICDFYTGGILLGDGGPSIYTSQTTSHGLSAAASMTIQSHDDNTRVTVEYTLSAAATPPEETFSWAAMAGTQGADPFGIPSHGVFLVIDVSNLGLHGDMEVLIEWDITGELGGDQEEATWDAFADYRYIPECGSPMSPPIPLFEVIEGAGNPSGSRSIQLGNVLSSQIVIEMDVGIIAGAVSEIRDEDGQLIEPAKQSNGNVEGFIEIIVVSEEL